MGETVRITTAENRDVVRVLGEIGKQIRNRQAGFTVLVETPRGPKQFARIPHLEQTILFNSRHCFTVKLREHRFGVKKINLARAAIHEKANDGFGRMISMRWPRSRWPLSSGVSIEVSICSQQRTQRQRRKTTSGFPKPLPPCWIGNRRHGIGWMRCHSVLLSRRF